MIRVRMIPDHNNLARGVSGIHTVAKAWIKHLPNYGVHVVGRGEPADLVAVHAGMADVRQFDLPMVAHLHGFYWTADYEATRWEWDANSNVIASARLARQITVPSEWVAETVKRDMRLTPHVLPHGIDYEEWNPGGDRDSGYVIGYAKNRVGDVCDPNFLTGLAERFPNITFYTTFAPRKTLPNIHEHGVISHEDMKKLVENALCVISPIKETFGVLTLEAMAAAKPVLGYAYGGNVDLIKHGVNGYLAFPNHLDDLANGLDYCIQNRHSLGDNGRLMVQDYSWDKVCESIFAIYNKALEIEPNLVSVIIPSYNYADKIGGAIESVQNQIEPVHQIIVVDDGSDDDGETERVVSQYSAQDERVIYVRQDNQGVAVARNRGIDLATSKYVCCLDADDRIEERFLTVCVDALEKDESLGIAYTGLMTVMPDGTRKVSQWPPDYNFDKMVSGDPKGINQIPTCCVFRKEMWRRLGGYRQRYAPQGAGSEDAEFWLRAGLHGWGAKKVSPAPMFLYSYLSGNVSGNRNYTEVDWHALHPSCYDQEHPFPSVASPVGYMPSHPVRQYDEPAISVIIPVGKGHESVVFDALDSLESQNMRKWEAIVVNDTKGNWEDWSFDGVSNIAKAYPYARVVNTSGNRGAGHARNKGAEIARAPLLLFLDADDVLYSTSALQLFLDAWNTHGSIIYSDYVNKATIDPNEINKFRSKDILVSYNENNNIAVIRGSSPEYDCEKAKKQPSKPLYIWNLITSLIPKAWHDEAGGFDEALPSWEDWLYWLVQAKMGRCFVCIPEPLVMYRMNTGRRREEGRKIAASLLDYIEKTLEGVDEMPCSGCGGKKASSPSARLIPVQQGQDKQMIEQINDADMVLCSYENPNRGQHRVIGFATGIDYQYRAGGGTEKFYVHKDDIAARPDFFKPVPAKFTTPEAKPVVEAASPPPPTPQPEPMTVMRAHEKAAEIAEESTAMIDLQIVPGMSAEIAEQLYERGVETWEDVVELSEQELLGIKGVGEKRAQTILAYAKKVLNIED